jgi:hypothetical protein
MTPRLVSFVFGESIYDRLARVLRHTARMHCPHWDVHIARVAPATHDPRDGQVLVSALGKASYLANTQKMLAWASVVEQAPDGLPLVLIDCDTFLTGPLDAVWDFSFDFAYTVKVPGWQQIPQEAWHPRIPFNSGVVFCRVSERVREFFRAWRDENLTMLRDRDHHRLWRNTYGGINQAALGRAMQSGWLRALHVHELPCQIWNCEDANWAKFGPETRIVHVKSALRLAIRGDGPALDSFRPLVSLWRRLEAETR